LGVKKVVEMNEKSPQMNECYFITWMFALLEYFSCSHVDHVHIPFGVNHDVLRLYVSIDNVPRVEILHAEDKSANVKLTVLS